MIRDHTTTDDTATSKKYLKKQGGFTLIEVLIAITIFAVGLLAIAAMQTSAMRMNSTAGKMTNVSTWGMDQIEQLMALPYTSSQLNPAGPFPSWTTPDGYNVQYTVQQNPDTFAPASKVITVWVQGKGERFQATVIRASSYGKSQ